MSDHVTLSFTGDAAMALRDHGRPLDLEVLMPRVPIVGEELNIEAGDDEIIAHVRTVVWMLNENVPSSPIKAYVVCGPRRPT